MLTHSSPPSSSPVPTQDCFKSYWPTHKSIHKIGKQLLAARLAASASSSLPPYLSWSLSYPFSGSLRPFQQTPKREVPDSIRKPDYADHPDGRSYEEESDKSGGRTIKVYKGEELEVRESKGLRAKRGRERC